MKKQEEGRDERRARRSDYQEDCHCANTTRLLACDLCAPASWCLVGYLLIAVIYLYYYTLLLSEQYSMQYIGWK